MIKQLTVKNWKSFEKATFFVDPLTILIGANASGKSNLLDAFLFLHRISANVGISQAVSGDVNLPPLRGGLEWICRKPENSFTIEAVIEASEKQDYLYTISCIVNDVKAEVFHESLCVLTYSGKNKKPREKYLFRTAQEEASTPDVPTYFYTATQGRGKRIDLNRTHCILSQADTLNLRKEVVNGIKKVLSELQLMAGGSLGQLYTQGKIEKALKMTDSLVDEPSAAVKKQKRKPPVELKEKVTECGSIMSSAPLSEWGIETS